jgi:hypothetical protein
MHALCAVSYYPLIQARAITHNAICIMRCIIFLPDTGEGFQRKDTLSVNHIPYMEWFWTFEMNMWQWACKISHVCFWDKNHYLCNVFRFLKRSLLVLVHSTFFSIFNMSFTFKTFALLLLLHSNISYIYTYIYIYIYFISAHRWAFKIPCIWLLWNKTFSFWVTFIF